MKKITRGLLIVSILALVANVLYIKNNIVSFNVLHFLGLIILLPCILVALISTCIIAETPLKKFKWQGLIHCIVAGISSVFAFFIAHKRSDMIDVIIENSKRLSETSNLSMSDINVNNGVSSYVFIFILIAVLGMIFNLILNAFSGRGQKNVCKFK